MRELLFCYRYMDLVKFYDLHICTWHARLYVVMTDRSGRYCSSLHEVSHLIVIEHQLHSRLYQYHAICICVLLYMYVFFTISSEG